MKNHLQKMDRKVSRGKMEINLVIVCLCAMFCAIWSDFSVAAEKKNKAKVCSEDYVFLQKVPKVFYWDGKRQEGYDIKDLPKKWHHNKDILIKNLFLSCAVSKFESCYGKMKLQVVSKQYSEVLKLESYKKNINENWYKTEKFNLDKHLPESMSSPVKVNIKIFRDGGYLCTKTINII